MRATLRILASMLIGVLIAWLFWDTRTPEDPWQIAKRCVQVDVCGETIPPGLYARAKREAEERWVREYLSKKKLPSEDTVLLITGMCFWATIFGMLAAYSLLFDLKRLGLLQRLRERALDASQL